LEAARRLNRHVPRVDRALTHAEEMCSVATQTLFRSVHDWVPSGMPEPDERYTRQARRAWAELLAELVP
jgi:hypothetical protein